MLVYQRVFRIFQDISGYFRIFQDISGYFRIFQDISGYFRIFQDISGYFRIFQDISGYFRIQEIWVMLCPCACLILRPTWPTPDDSAHRPPVGAPNHTLSPHGLPPWMPQPPKPNMPGALSLVHLQNVALKKKIGLPPVRDVIRREVCRVGFDQRNPKPETRNRLLKLVSNCETRNPKPTLKTYLPQDRSKPETRNPKPETRNPKPTLKTYFPQDRSKPETRNPKPTLKTYFPQDRSKPETRNPKPTLKTFLPQDRSKPETRNPKPETDSESWFQSTKPETRNPKPETDSEDLLSPGPIETRNPKPETDSESWFQSTKPETRNPKPETRNRLESDFWVALRIGTPQSPWIFKGISISKYIKMAIVWMSWMIWEYPKNDFGPKSHAACPPGVRRTLPPLVAAVYTWLHRKSRGNKQVPKTESTLQNSHRLVSDFIKEQQEFNIICQWL